MAGGGRRDRRELAGSVEELDRSSGVHNLPYARALMRRAAEDIRGGFAALDPDEVPRVVPVGPRAVSDENCTTLCHTGIETVEVKRFGRYGFDHAPHFLRAGLDCSDCHKAEPHGTTFVEPSTCVDCHHEDAEDEEQCAQCHIDVVALRASEIEGGEDPMADLDCLACHESIAEGHDVDAIKAACDDCHEDDGPDFAAEEYDAWMASARAPLDEVERRLASAPPDVARAIRREIEALRPAGPFHNAAFVKAQAARWLKRLESLPGDD
jgi:hypothetical protein